MMEDVMKEAGLLRPAPKASESDKFDLKQELNDSGLDLRSLFSQIATVLETSDNEQLKQRTRESVLKMHGVLKENTVPPAPPVMIVINDPNSNFSINPILLPREIQGNLS
jgi:hypothetical protein